MTNEARKVCLEADDAEFEAMHGLSDAQKTLADFPRR